MPKKLSPAKHKALFQRVLNHFGGKDGRPRDLMRAMGPGVFPQHITHWRNRGFSPDAAVKIEALTDGAFTRQQLRPDLFGDKAA